MITESLLLFITSMLSLNQSAEISKKQFAEPKHRIEIRQFTESTPNHLFRGGWDGN